uniref:Uncharacterized protein n=2 Tax=Rousettus aegyptiacus TaxID=9407 RepID=A0A7J8F482_ROUAE|nr:hypothetical protein HJG63_019060 [Rousettus aegyptiacus]
MNISTFLFAEGVTFWKQREMECPTTRNEEKKCSRLSQATTSFGGGSKASLSRSEEFLTRISTELTNEALFIAGYHMNPVPTKEKQTQDRGTQISKHVFFTKTRGTDTRSDRNRTHTKAHLLPSPRDKSSQFSVAPVKLMANYNIKWMSAHNRNGNSRKSTYPSLNWDRKERNHGVPTERIFREKNRELCLAV